MLKREQIIEWIARAFLTFDLFAICAGYLSFFQARRQLISPLIPDQVVAQLIKELGGLYTKASLICAALFFVGLWLYTFKRKIAAIILFVAALVAYKLILLTWI